MEKTYIAIDLKSFYASVECTSRGLDPLTTNLVVADESRTEKTICLAVSPSLKSFGISGRARLYEVVQRVKQVNKERERLAPNRTLTVKSVNINELEAEPALELDYIVAKPRMAKYMEISTKIYDIYLKYIAPEDIHVYSIDEVFIDASMYLKTYNMTGRELAMTMIQDVLNQTGITATAGIGTNLYLCKIAMDIMAKKMPADKNGVRIAELDEMTYRKELWDHKPLTDFWRIGRGYARKLEANNMFTMGDVARFSLFGEDYLYRLFGINAELLIDHAWGYEPCTISDIKAYRPENSSLSSGQVLPCPYEFGKGKLIVREMTELLALDLVDKGLVTNQMVLTVGYDISNLQSDKYHGEIEKDFYGRMAPKRSHGSINLKKPTSSTKIIVDAVVELFESIVDKNLTIRRMYVVANNVIREEDAPKDLNEQMDLFTDYEAKQKEEKALEREKRKQKAVLEIQKKYGKNAVLKAFNLEEGATTIKRNGEIGGHNA